MLKHYSEDSVNKKRPIKSLLFEVMIMIIIMSFKTLYFLLGIAEILITYLHLSTIKGN